MISDLRLELGIIFRALTNPLSSERRRRKRRREEGKGEEGREEGRKQHNYSLVLEHVILKESTSQVLSTTCNLIGSGITSSMILNTSERLYTQSVDEDITQGLLEMQNLRSHL